MFMFKWVYKNIVLHFYAYKYRERHGYICRRNKFVRYYDRVAARKCTCYELNVNTENAIV